MNPNCVRKPEQIKLIMECRQSGLSDYQWCRKQGINPGTFYNWVSKLRKAGYTIPEPPGKVSAAPVMQEVVKLDLAEGGISAPDMMGKIPAFQLCPLFPVLPPKSNAGISGCASLMELTPLLFKIHFSVSGVWHMLGDISGAANIYIITGYTGMRKSIDGLYVIIMSQLQQEPCRQKGLCDIFPCDRLWDQKFRYLFPETGRYQLERTVHINCPEKDPPPCYPAFQPAFR